MEVKLFLFLNFFLIYFCYTLNSKIISSCLLNFASIKREKKTCYLLYFSKEIYYLIFGGNYKDFKRDLSRREENKTITEVPLTFIGKFIIKVGMVMDASKG